MYCYIVRRIYQPKFLVIFHFFKQPGEGTLVPSVRSKILHIALVTPFIT